MNKQKANNQSRLKKALLTVQKMRSQLETQKSFQNEPIAIIGMGCRFPGDAKDPESFWSVLKNSVDTIKEIPRSRWDVDQLYDPDPDIPGRMYVRQAALINDVDKFDANFFGIAPTEAISMDPQHRLLLEVSWEALENAGQPPLKLKNSQTGVFVGITSSDYLQLQARLGDESNIDAYSITGTSLNTVAGRLSYVLGLQGPSMAIDTACSSSLVAIHLACQSLRNRECNKAIAGGVNLILSPYSIVAACKTRILSPDGRCKTFDERADGIGRGEGCGIIILKRLSDAIVDKDSILALIKGSAVNQNGSSSGLTIPNGIAQEALIKQALANASTEPLQVSYVEAQGTGSAFGDSIEIESLASVLCEKRSFQQPLYVGSAKTNIGHLDSASGVAGLIKLVLSMQHQEIPAHLHFQNPNSHINWDKIPINIVTRTTPWKSLQNRLIAGLSSFGISGTNAHLILEQAPDSRIQLVEEERPLHILNLSAKSKEALKELTERFKHYLTSHSSIPIGDICFTANTGRSHFRHRLSLLTESTTQLKQQLNAFSSDKEPQNLYLGDFKSTSHPKMAFLFSEKQIECLGLGKQLYETQPTFHKTLNRCQELLASYLTKPLISVLYSEKENLSTNNNIYVQPALFAVEYALSYLLMSWGIKPTSVMGYGIGEYVAATVAGVFSLEDGLKLAVARGHLLQTSVNEDSGNLFLDSDIIDYADVVTKINYSHPQISVVSCITGEPIYDEVASSEYWLDHLSQSINYAGGIVSLYRQQCRIFMEIGPQQGLLVFGRQCLESTLPQLEPTLWLSTLQLPNREWQQLLKCLAILFNQGVEVNWSSFDRDYSRSRIYLPTYPFQRQRYWFTEEDNRRDKTELSSINFKHLSKSNFSSISLIQRNIENASINDREKILVTYLQKNIAEVLRIKTSKVDISRDILELGVDSLMIIEILSNLKADLSISVEDLSLMRVMSIGNLATQILRQKKW